MKLQVLLAVLGVSSISEAKRPPWYKPCWVYMCGLDLTDPVCAWDPHHGARLFRNNCEMDRHNFCYNRNYAIADSSNTGEQDVRLCKKLQNILAHTDKKTPLVEDGNIRVHFIEDPNRKKQRHAETMDKSEERSKEYRFNDRERFTHGRERDQSINYPLFDRYSYKPAGHKTKHTWSREDSDSSFSSAMN